ncbi:MAG: ATP-binding protein [Lachnospiraceae bacterium]|nr:ATP-binding protein [Lachnospiraceae bacterium]
MHYYSRAIDKELVEWKNSTRHKPLLIRGARQVGKSTAVRHLGETFDHYLEVNLERDPEAAVFFKQGYDVNVILSKLSAYYSVTIVPGSTLLFIDEIQNCMQAIEALRFFWEDMPELHVIGAGSLLEFALQDIPTFAVGRIRSFYMYPMSFDEYLEAVGQAGLIALKQKADSKHPLDDVFHNRLVNLFRDYIMIGGMPEAVAEWMESKDYLKVSQVHDDIVTGYDRDFAKYKKRISPDLIRLTLNSVVHQMGQKFVYHKVSDEYQSAQVKEALRLLTLAGLITPVIHTDANGLPLNSEQNSRYIKYIYLDCGLMLRILGIETNSQEGLRRRFLSDSASDLVNKGSVAEMIAGCELIKYSMINHSGNLNYWVRTEKNSVAEVDYIIVKDGAVTPVEVKAGTRGGMKSMYMFLDKKGLQRGIRICLENFSEYENGSHRISVIPLYALSGIYRNTP